MTILSIETSGPILSMSIWKDGVFLSTYMNDERHVASKEIASKTIELIQNSNIELNSINYALYNSGPGSFTGLRVGLSFLKGLFFNAETQIISIPTFDCLLHNTQNRIGFFESKRDEIYTFSKNQISTLKKIDFRSHFPKETKFITYRIPAPNELFNGFDILIKPYDSIHLIEVFLSDKAYYINDNSRLEINYFYE